MREAANAIPVDDVVELKLDEYRHPYWLTFMPSKGMPVGDFRQAGSLELDFSGTSAAGLCLTAEKNRDLLDDIVLLLGMQTHRDTKERGTRAGSEHADKRGVMQMSVIIDYFLVRARQFNLAKRGFSAITENQLRQVLVDAATHNNVHEWVYQWRAQLNRFIRDTQSRVGTTDIEAAKNYFPEIDIVDDEQADILGDFTAEEIIRTRIYLFKHKLFKSASCVEYGWIPDSPKLADQFYKGTLRGRDPAARWPVPRELCWLPRNRYSRECKNASIASADESEDGTFGASEASFLQHRRRLLTFRLLAKYGRGVPMSSIASIEKVDFREALKLKPPGRTFTLPPDYVLQCMAKATEFFFEHGEHLLSSYFNILKAARDNHQTVRRFVHKRDIADYCRQETLDLGVKYFSLARTVGSETFRRGRRGLSPRPTSHEFFERVRRCEGLTEAVEALLGGIAFTIGTLMAARDGELDDLKIAECLTETRRWMTLQTRKSGTPELRDADARPLPEIAQRMIELLQEFHSSCQAEGIRCPEYLFSLPERHISQSNARALDLFIDFIDAPKLEDGSRYYVRQHMLRRFFAIVFFCHAGLEGLAPLRWMLRHSDIEHLYNYITEAIPGRMMRLVKATAASMMVREGNVEYIALADFLRKYLGADRFDVMSERELTAHIEYLQRIGTVVIEPVFLDRTGQRNFHIGIQIWEREISESRKPS